MYGYEITKKVEELSNGKIMLTYGALYPVLHKLEAENLVTTEKEMIGKRARIYYQLTDTGKKKTRDLVDEFIEFVKVMGYIINPYPSIAWVV